MESKWKKAAFLLLCTGICCTGFGCGQRTANSQMQENESESVEEVSEKESEKESTEWETTETKPEEKEGIETPEEKTTRLRSELPEAPSMPPEEATDISIEIHKSEHSLQLWNGEKLIAEYAVGLAKNPTGAKEKEGDNKNPEGEYYVCNKNSKSQYHLALGLSYPNMEDAKRGYEDGMISEQERDALLHANETGGQPNWYTALGGEIMIHGQKGEKGGESDWTRGCFAVDNEVMDFIWDYIKVGTKVTITAE